MECFRLSHAGVVLEERGASLLIDPGSFTDSNELSLALAATNPPAGLVITHEHPDHWTPEHVATIRTAAPGCPIFTTSATAAALRSAGMADVDIVREGDRRTAGPFELEFYGRRHAVLHASIPVIDNIGVRVNSVFAYGGDSLVRPPFASDVLGVPIGSPWSNIGQVMDFVLDAAPARAYLTHDAMLSPAGLGLFESRVHEALAVTGGELLVLPRVADPDTPSTARFRL